MNPRIDPAGKAAKRAAPAKLSCPAKEHSADCVRVAQSISEVMTARRDEVLRGPSATNVHAFRGALRRAAGALKLFKSEVSDGDEAWSRAELKWLARQFGGVRDLDVLIGRLETASHPWTDAAREDELVLAAALRARAAAPVTASRSTTSVRAMGIVDELAAWVKVWKPMATNVTNATHLAALSAADAKIRGYGAGIGHFSSHPPSATRPDLDLAI